jgi:hypothetical protein
MQVFMLASMGDVKQTSGRIRLKHVDHCLSPGDLTECVCLHNRCSLPFVLEFIMEGRPWATLGAQRQGGPATALHGDPFSWRGL